jgi:hypothetical protein
MSPAFNLLSREHSADRRDASQHDVRKLFHKEICQGQMEPGIQSGEASSQKGTHNENGAEQAQHSLEITHYELPQSWEIHHAGKVKIDLSAR